MQKRRSERSWNNPVVRIVSSQEQELVSRLAGDYSIGGLVAKMKEALRANKSAMPLYLKLLAQEYTAQKLLPIKGHKVLSEKVRL